MLGSHLFPLLLLFQLLERPHDGVDLPLLAGHLALGALVLPNLLGGLALRVVTCRRVDAVLTLGKLCLDIELIGDLLLDGDVHRH